MPTPWRLAVRQRKTLLVSGGTKFMGSSVWGPAMFKDILDEFNKLARPLGLEAVPETTAPEAEGTGGANVQIEISGGTHSFRFNKEDFTGQLEAHGAILGKCHLIVQSDEVQGAFIFLPETVNIDNTGGRPVGRKVKMALAIHELVHACGINGTDAPHNRNPDPDVFTTGGTLDANFPPDGNPGDRIRFLPSTNTAPVFVPPFRLSGDTKKLIQSNWKVSP